MPTLLSKVNVRWLLFGMLILPVPYLLSDLVYLNYGDMYRYLKFAIAFDFGTFRLFTIDDRTTLYPFILSCLFKGFGYSLYAIKVFDIVILSLICCQAWLICRKLFGNNSGIISAFFIVSSFVFGNFAYFPHIDILLLFFLNCCLLLLHKSATTKRKQTKWILLSGLFIGLTYALKQSVIILVIFLPVYLWRVERFSIYRAAGLWAVQLVGISVFLVPIIIASYPLSFGYMSHYANLINHAEGALQLSRDPSFMRILTYFFNPVLWQWDNILTYNAGMVTLDQIIGFGSFIVFIGWCQVEKKSKAFIILMVLIFIPWYVYVAFKGLKIRQLLFPEFLIFLTIGPVVQDILGRRLKPKLSQARWLRTAGCLCLLLLLIYGIRVYSVHQNIHEGVEKAKSMEFPRPDPLYGLGHRDQTSLERLQMVLPRRYSVEK